MNNVLFLVCVTGNKMNNPRHGGGESYTLRRTENYIRLKERERDWNIENKDKERDHKICLVIYLTTK